MDWFRAMYEGREAFDSQEEEGAYRNYLAYITEREVRSLSGLVGLKAGQRILDLFCGNGRHGVMMARNGIRVVGVDIARSRVHFASRWAREEGVPATFLVGDVTCPSLKGSFDGAFILGGSFSHLGNWDCDVKLLELIGTMLSPGGFILIDNPNPIRFLKVREPQRDWGKAHELSWFDFPLGGKSGGFVRYWGANSISVMLKEAGYREVSVLGDRDGGPYNNHSPRLLALGRK